MINFRFPQKTPPVQTELIEPKRLRRDIAHVEPVALLKMATEYKMTQVEVGQEIGIDGSSVSQYLKAKSCPKKVEMAAEAWVIKSTKAIKQVLIIARVNLDDAQTVIDALERDVGATCQVVTGV